MALIPLYRNENPHLGTQPAQPPPANRSTGRAPYMTNNGRHTNLVITSRRTFSNVKPTQVANVEANRHEYLSLTICLGGQRYFACYKDVLDDIYKTLAAIASPEEMQLYRANPIITQTGDWSQKYMYPFSVFAHFTDPAVRTAIYDQRTFAATQLLAFHADTIDPARRNWGCGGWSPVTIIKNIPEMLKAFRAALILYILKTLEVFHLVAQMTQGHGGNLTPFERVRDFAYSVNAQYYPHATDPLIAGFVRPIGTNEDDNEALKAMLRPVRLSYGMLAFTPKSRNGEAIECVMCKAEDSHLAYLCPRPFPHGAPPPASGAAPGDDWWGPPDQMSKLKDGILSVAPPRSNNNGGGGGGTRNGGGGGNRNGGRNDGGGRNGGNGTRYGGNGGRNNGRRNGRD
ncbi:hypothetical protein FB451DRAFT_1374711 [Mycena latifolia]|nr:hypothetical protein FB451DRAFT_1374711 [Mycena latifolia]